MSPESFSALGSCALIATALGWVMYQFFATDKTQQPTNASEQHEDQISGL